MAIWGYAAMMDRIPLDSSTLASAAFDTATGLLELEFCSGALYRYCSVPASLYHDLLAADSKGRFFNRFIRNRFPSTLVAPPAAPKTI
jgi:KTSC domain